jgi:hypothetical protein
MESSIIGRLLYCRDIVLTVKPRLLDSYIFCSYNSRMENRRGRPPKGSDRTKGELLQIRLESAEKRAFEDAAELAGLALSAWVRERLRIVARKELEKNGKPVAFLRVARNGNETT